MVYILQGILNFPNNQKSQTLCSFQIPNGNTNIPSWSTHTLGIQQPNLNNLNNNPCILNLLNGSTTSNTINDSIDPLILHEQWSRNTNLELIQGTMSPVWNGDYRSGGNTFPILLGMPTSIKGENRSSESDQSQQSNCSKTNHGTTDNVTSTTRSLSEDDSFHIFVGDLAPEVQDETLLAAFSNFGTITECKIIKDMHTQKPKGYGFVAYATRQEAERAIRIMNGQIIGTRAIRTNWAVRKDPADQAKDHRPLNYLEVFNASSSTNTTIYVGGITNELTEKLLQDSFKQFGEIKEIRIFKDKGFSFIRFDSHVAATQAIVTMHGKIVGDQACKCSWGKEPTFTNKQGLAKRLSSAMFVPTLNHNMNDDRNGILLKPQGSWLTSPSRQNNLILDLPAKKYMSEELHPVSVSCITPTDKTQIINNGQHLSMRNVLQDANKLNGSVVNPIANNPLWPYTCWFAGNPNQDTPIPALLFDNVTRGTLTNQTVIPFVPSTDNNPLLLSLSAIELAKNYQSEKPEINIIPNITNAQFSDSQTTFPNIGDIQNALINHKTPVYQSVHNNNNNNNNVTSPCDIQQHILNLKNMTIPNLDLTNYSALSNIPLITFSAYPFNSTNISPFNHTTTVTVPGTIVNTTTNSNEIDKNSIHQSAQLSNFGQYTVYNTTTG
uniref:Nucleolysin TIA-1/TIAR n=1 Tax=Schistosoma mansoni TaxID=6183 RepID=A0A5K4F2J4_SCHMA